MSRKTESIYNSLKKLSDIQENLAVFSLGDETRELENLSFQMKQELSTLKFWFDSLYLFNGKSKSHAKQNASRENGRKGGRPPKEITEARRRISELFDQLIPEEERKIRGTIEESEEKASEEKLEEYTKELKACTEKVKNWEKFRLSQEKSDAAGEEGDISSSKLEQ